MMMQEFTERTGFEPTYDEYREIEEAYYDFDGNKDEFCADWVKNDGASKVYAARVKKIEQLKSQMLELDRQAKKAASDYEAKIKRLEKKLEEEQEWKPYEDPHNVKQADYDALAADSFTKILSDDEAKEMIAQEFGFDPAKITIVHEVFTEEINRHGQLRRSGTTPRMALFHAWDWNYIVFNIKGTTTMGWEMHNGHLQMYWG